MFRIALAAAISAATFLLASDDASSGGICKFKPVKPARLKNMGPCNFDPVLKSFAGSPAQQAMCLARPVLKGGYIAATPLESLPEPLEKRIGTSSGFPSRGDLQKIIDDKQLASTLGKNLDRPISFVNDESEIPRRAAYFVIHDTSSPNYRSRSWPDDLDTHAKLNSLERYSCDNNIERAHIFINRLGAVLLGHDFEVPWRATKFESAQDFGTALRGLFVHVELIQPRRHAPGFGRGNDFGAPEPGFSQAQYDTLATAYIVASTRAGRWLIPAFHAVLDEGIYDKHDDPQNFELAKFADSLDRIMSGMTAPERPAANSSGVAGSEGHRNQ